MLSIKHLHKTYQRKEGLKHHALKGIDLEFGSKGFIVLLGKSGSGKSTLLNILGGLDQFDEGEIIIKDKSTIDFKASEWDSYRNTYVGFVFQEFYIIEEYTVGKNISLALELQGYPKEGIDERVAEILSQVDLDGYMNRRPNEISGGQKQRIAIARALVKNPQIILADEPTGNLDSETGVMILETLKRLSKDKLVIMVTHDADFAREYGDRIIELKDGEVISDQINYNQSVANEKIYEVNHLLKSVIRLPKGKQLTQKMINYLNDCLINEEKDLYLSITDKKELLEKYVPLINDQNKEMEFDVENHLKSELNDAFSLKKSSLPFKHAYKLALHSLFTRKVRLVFIVFLFVCSLISVGIASIFTFYDIGKASILTFNQAGVKHISIIKNVEECYDAGGKEYCYFREGQMEDEEIKQLKANYPDILFTTSSRNYLPLTGMSNFQRNNKTWSIFDSDTITTVSVRDETIDLLYGTLGVKPNEVLVTDYIAEMLVNYHAFNDVVKMEDLINQAFTFNDLSLKITGIVETDYQNYAYLKESKNEYLDYNSSFSYNREYIYSQLFVSKDLFDSYFKDEYSIRFVNARLSENSHQNERLIEDLEPLNYTHRSQVSHLLNYLNDITKNGKNILYVIGAVIALFTSFMIFTFISSSIVAKKKEIGTLRAIGARGIDVSKIFLTEGLMLAFLSGFISNIFIALIVRWINQSITTNFSVNLVLLYVNLITILIVFGLAIVVIIISTYLPLKRISKMRPINAIKNN